MFDPAVKILTSLGVADNRFALEGRVGFLQPAEGTSCTLSARGGCLGGVLELDGTGIEWPMLAAGQIVEFYWDRHNLTTKFWRGRIKRGVERTVEGNTHRYTLAGCWAAGIEAVRIATVYKLGINEGLGGTGTVSACVAYALQTIMGVGGQDLARDMTRYEASRIAECLTAVQSLTVLRDSKLPEIFEQLELMAQGGDDEDPPRHWVIGADHDGVPYFNALSEDNILATFEVGTDVVSGGELVNNPYPHGVIAVAGARIETGAGTGLIAKRIKNNPYLEAAESNNDPKKVYGPGLVTSADIDVFSEGWFRRFGKNRFQVRELNVFRESGPLRPWEGMINYRRPDENGTLTDNYMILDTVEFSFGEGQVLRLALGDEQEPRTSRNQPGTVREMIRELAGVDEFEGLPEATVDEPPAGSGGGGGGVVALTAFHDHRTIRGLGQADFISGGL